MLTFGVYWWSMLPYIAHMDPMGYGFPYLQPMGNDEKCSNSMGWYAARYSTGVLWIPAHMFFSPNVPRHMPSIPHVRNLQFNTKLGTMVYCSGSYWIMHTSRKRYSFNRRRPEVSARTTERHVMTSGKPLHNANHNYLEFTTKCICLFRLPSIRVHVYMVIFEGFLL